MEGTTKSPIKTKAIYTQIEDQLRLKIQQQEWPTGTMLPSRRDLAREYGVSSLTIDRAVTRLIAEGLLRADDRRGTFVRDRGESVAGGENTVSPSHSSPAEHQVIATIASLYPTDSQNHLELNNFWVRLLLQSSEYELSERGRTNRFFNRVRSHGEPLIPIKDAISTVLADRVDALVLIALGIDPQILDTDLAVLEGRDIPVVCITSGELSRPIPHLFYDNRSAGYRAAEHLLQRGCGEILFVSPFRAAWVEERFNGVQAAAKHAGVSAEAVHFFPSEPEPWVQENDPVELGYQVGKQTIAGGLARSGVICANDGVAFGFLRAAAENNLVPGRDFRILGFDDHSEARTIGLTSLRPPMEAMGKAAARLLSRVLSGEKTDLQMRFQSHLISRTTTSFPQP